MHLPWQRTNLHYANKSCGNVNNNGINCTSWIRVWWVPNCLVQWHKERLIDSVPNNKLICYKCGKEVINV